MISAVAGLSTFYPDSKSIHDEGSRWTQIVRLVAKMPTLAAFGYRHHQGLPYVYPREPAVLRRQLPQHALPDRR